MRAVVMRAGKLVVDDVAEPVPATGQVLVEVKACGICGSDLHFLRHGERMVGLAKQLEESAGEGGPSTSGLDLTRDIIMGHEFSAEVLAAGPDTLAPPPGTAVTAMPILITADGRIVSTAYSDEYGGGYAERMLLAAPLLLEVPNGLDHRRASLTEPMAVGLHAVAKSAIGNAHAAVVMGCGPVGLAVIAACRLAGVELVVAADLSPRRRALAEAMGAHVVVDAARESAVAAWRKADGTRPVVIFEAVGVPGMIDAALREAPRDARVVVVGVCMEPDTVQPFFGIAKELEVRFVLGYTPDEFAASLRHIAEGDIDVAPLITSVVGLDGVAPAFEALSRPDEQAKILVEP